MCGIVGIIDHSGRDVAILQSSIKRMNDALAHRGPDDWGIVMLQASGVRHHSMARPEGEHLVSPRPRHDQESVLLGHRRLAIIDLSAAGHQPMGTADGRYWLSLNGEIYNYRELRDDLEATGVTFHSTSDTEVVLAMFAREGVECLERLRGMFAFAIWDAQERTLFMARDRFGIKPLYYAQTAERMFLFASELKAILASGFFSNNIDEESEITFLQRGSIPAPKTFYRDLKALPPAHWAKFADKQIRIESYWSLSKTLAAAKPGGFMAVGERAVHVRDSLIESVKAHMVSDVPVGVLLSGGLDSTAIVAAIRQFYSGPLKTFTIISPGTQLDESHFARQAAVYYGTDHTEIKVTKEDFYNAFDDLFLAMDQPTVDGVNTYFVAKSVRQAGAKVALSGLGGDEILGGYKSFVHVPRIQRFLRVARYMPWFSGLSSSLVECLPISRASKLAQLLRLAPDNLEALWRDYHALFTDDQIRDLGLLVRDCSTAPSLRTLGSIETHDSFRSVAQLEIKQFMTPQLLRDSDVFAMCHGLELRTPLVDHIFLSAAFEAGTWPRNGAPSYKIALFRQMGGFLPADHLMQPKRGFTLPFEAWLKDALRNKSSSGIGRDMSSLLNQSRYRLFVEKFLRGNMHWSRIWGLYVLERFKRNARAA